MIFSTQIQAGGFSRHMPAAPSSQRGSTIDAMFRQAAQLALEQPELSKEQHFARLLRANPAAYEEYLATHPSHTGGGR